MDKSTGALCQATDDRTFPLKGDQRSRVQFVFDKTSDVCDESMVGLGLAILGFEGEWKDSVSGAQHFLCGY